MPESGPDLLQENRQDTLWVRILKDAGTPLSPGQLAPRPRGLKTSERKGPSFDSKRMRTEV